MMGGKVNRVIGHARLSHVKRWGIVATSREQSVAEHSGLVAMVARRLCDELHILKNPQDRALLLTWALVHDAPEIRLGDIPTPAKKLMGLGALGRIERQVDPDYAAVMEEVDTSSAGALIRDVVKVADLVEAILFLRTWGAGRNAELVCDGLLADLASKSSAMAESIGMHHGPSRASDAYDLMFEVLAELQS